MVVHKLGHPKTTSFHVYKLYLHAFYLSGYLYEDKPSNNCLVDVKQYSFLTSRMAAVLDMKLAILGQQLDENSFIFFTRYQISGIYNCFKITDFSKSEV